MKRCRLKGCAEPVARAATGRPKQYCSDAHRVAAWRKRKRRPRTTLEVMGSSRSDEWPTDPAVFAALAAEFGGFDLDPAATAENAKCARYFTREDDGLAQAWAGRVWLNPPYGRTIGLWMRKAWESSQTTADLVVCLVPVRTGSSWWQDYAMKGDIRFIRGRLRFGDLSNSAPFDSAVVVFRNPFRNSGSVTELSAGKAA